MRLSGWHGERVAREPLAGRVKSARFRVVGSGPAGERATPTALRAQGPLPLGQDPLSSRAGLASLLPRWWPADTSTAPWSGWSTLGVITPHDVAVVIGRRDLDEAVPELGAADVLLCLIAADVALEHHVAVVGRPDHLPPVLGELVEEIGDLGQTLRGLSDVLAQPSGIRALPAIGSIELVADRSEHVDQDVCRRRRHVREFSRAPLRSGSRRRNPSRSRREHHS